MQNGKVIVCFPFVGDLIGGSHVSALRLIQSLDRSRYTPLVTLEVVDGPVATLLQREGVSFEPAPTAGRVFELRPSRGLKSVAHLARTLPRIVRFLRERGVAIVHTNDGRTHATWGPAARFAGAKLLWHHRDDPAAFGLRRIAPWAANRVVTVSRFASPRPGLFSAASKSSVVHSPFDTSAPAPDRPACRARLLAELGCPPETRLLGYVGTLVARKRPLLFVETMASLHRLAPDLEFIGLMFGGELDSLAERVISRANELGVSDRVRLMGFRYPVEPWLAALDLLVATAVDEPFGRTLIEAMLLRTPVVAAASGGNPEAIRSGETGLLVQPDDSEAFAEAASKIFSDPGLAGAIVDRAEADARARFGVSKHVEAITQVYQELVPA